MSLLDSYFRLMPLPFDKASIPDLLTLKSNMEKFEDCFLFTNFKSDLGQRMGANMKYCVFTTRQLPASFTPTSNGFVEGRSLLVVYGFYFFPTLPSGPPWNEGHRPRVRHETSVLEVLAPGTTRTLLLFKFY